MRIKSIRSAANGITKLFIIGSLLIIPQAAFADAGLPMIAMIMPAFALAIIPIVVIESIYISKKLQLPGKAVGKTVTISNLVSTVIGIPLTWFLLVVIQMATGGGKAHGLDSVMGKVM